MLHAPGKFLSKSFFLGRMLEYHHERPRIYIMIIGWIGGFVYITLEGVIYNLLRIFGSNLHAIGSHHRLICLFLESDHRMFQLPKHTKRQRASRNTKSKRKGGVLLDR